MITINDFSERTTNLYNDIKNGDKAVSDLLDVLYDNDFPVKEILVFVKKEFGFLYDYSKHYLKNK